MKRRNFLKSHSTKRYRKDDRFKNPYFKKKTSHRPIVKKIITVLIGLALVTGIPYLFFTSSIFRIKSVEATGLITIQPSQIEDLTWNFLSENRLRVLPQNHIWLTDKKELTELLENDFQLTDVEVTRTGRKLAISASERISRAIWSSNNKQYFIDSEGLIVRELTLDEMLDVQERVYSGAESTNFIQSDIFLIFDEKREEVQINDQVLEPGFIDNLEIIDQTVPSLEIEPGDYLIEKRMTNWLTLKIKHGFDIYISGAGDPYDQLENLEVILSEYQNQVQEIEYVDLRFDNRVYIK